MFVIHIRYAAERVMIDGKAGGLLHSRNHGTLVGVDRADSPDSAPPHLCRGYPLIVSRREYGKRSSAYDALYLEATVSGPVAFGGVARSASAAAQRKSR